MNEPLNTLLGERQGWQRRGQLEMDSQGGRAPGHPMATLCTLPPHTGGLMEQDNPPAPSRMSQLSQQGGESLRGLLWCEAQHRARAGKRGKDL